MSLSCTKYCFKKGIRTVANLLAICPRHTGFGLGHTRVASGQREPRIIVLLKQADCTGLESSVLVFF